MTPGVGWSGRRAIPVGLRLLGHILQKQQLLHRPAHIGQTEAQGSPAGRPALPTPGQGGQRLCTPPSNLMGASGQAGSALGKEAGEPGCGPPRTPHPALQLLAPQLSPAHGCTSAARTLPGAGPECLGKAPTRGPEAGAGGPGTPQAGAAPQKPQSPGPAPPQCLCRNRLISKSSTSSKLRVWIRAVFLNGNSDVQACWRGESTQLWGPRKLGRASPPLPGQICHRAGCCPGLPGAPAHSRL